VPEDKRIELVADVVGGRIGLSASETGPSIVPIVLDRTPPLVGKPTWQQGPPRPAADGPPPHVFRLYCRAGDGAGSGVAKVEFVTGFDLNNNERLDTEERRDPMAGRRGSQDVYDAELVLAADSPSDRVVIEAIATDNVGYISAPARALLMLPRRAEGGAQRTTFGSKKVDEPPPGKKKSP
jgi:hypothetical protein